MKNSFWREKLANSPLAKSADNRPTLQSLSLGTVTLHLVSLTPEILKLFVNVLAPYHLHRNVLFIDER